MKRSTLLSTAALLCLVGSSTPGYTQQDQQDQKKAKPEEQARPAEQAKPEKHQEHEKGKGDQHAQRVSAERQQQLIAQQQQRMTQYRQHQDRQQEEQQRQAAQKQTAMLQEQRRESQYRHQEEYRERMRQQQMRLATDRDHDYDRDPYFYTAPIYRYQRGGSYYEINEFGAELLRRAVTYGYAEGFRTGEADRRDHWRFDYRESYAYQDANYGYTGYYVDQDEYNYYFRQGFRRGYEDGFYSRAQYGHPSHGSYIVLSITLGQILDFQSLR